MKTQLLSAVAVFMFVLAALSPGHARERPPEFTWQGILVDGDQVLDGQYDLLLRLFDAPEGGNQLGLDIVLPEFMFFDGKFYGTLDFGVDVFDGQTRWLEFAYKHTGPAGPYRVLWAPRSPVRRTHYEVMAEIGEFHRSLTVLCPMDIGTRTQLPIRREGAGIFGIRLEPVNASYERNAWTLWNMDGEYGNDFEIWQYPLDPSRSYYIPRLEIRDYGDTILVPSGGNVGIGTMSPAFKLDVAGSARVSLPSSGTYTDFRINDSAGSAALVVKNDGNVGIGTMSPTGRLDVNGHVVISHSDPYLKTDSKNKHMAISGGNGWASTGATMALRGANASYNAHGIDIHTGGSQTVAIDSDGNVGIGISNPIRKLDVRKAGVQFRLNYSDSEYAEFYKSNDGLAIILNGSQKVRLLDNGNVGIGTHRPGRRLEIQGEGPSSYVGIRLVNMQTGGGMWDILSTSSGGVNPGSLTFFNGSHRMVIAGTGRVGIATDSPAFMLHVNGSAGKPGGGSWSYASDARLKKNIHHLDGALQQLLQLRGVTFEYKEPEKINELPGVQIGMVAQEVERVFPHWVDTNADGFKTVTFRGFEVLVVEALRQIREEKNAEIARLEQRISELTARLEQIESMMSQVAVKELYNGAY